MSSPKTLLLGRLETRKNVLYRYAGRQIIDDEQIKRGVSGEKPYGDG
jgi:predicted ATPase